jgi:hypothetical protein
VTRLYTGLCGGCWLTEAAVRALRIRRAPATDNRRTSPPTEPRDLILPGSPEGRVRRVGLRVALGDAAAVRALPGCSISRCRSGAAGGVVQRPSRTWAIAYYSVPGFVMLVEIVLIQIRALPGAPIYAVSIVIPRCHLSGIGSRFSAATARTARGVRTVLVIVPRCCTVPSTRSCEPCCPCR